LSSNPYADVKAIQIASDDFETGTLQRLSYARPAKLFTASSSLMEMEVGRLEAAVFKDIVNAVVDILKRPFFP